MDCPVERHQFLTSWKDALSDDVKLKFGKWWVINEEDDYFGFIPEKATALFVGTFPVPENSTRGFFYHSDVNLFWPILEKISGCYLGSFEKKLHFLTKFCVGITDILSEVKRPDDNCDSRKDEDLIVVKYNNVFKILRNYPKISDIFLTSGGPTSKSLSGSSAGGWLGDHLRKVTGRNLKKVSQEMSTITVKIDGIERSISLHYLITPAPQDNQLGKHLRESPTARATLNSLNCLSHVTHIKEKYKVFQWSVKLERIEGIVGGAFTMGHTSGNFRSILMEGRSKSGVNSQ
jgi:G:T/U-mismatch repair DNA glycosylase